MTDIDPAWLAQTFEAGVAQLSTDSDVRFSDHAFRDTLNLLLVAVADNLQDRSAAVESAKKRGWKSTAAELQLAAHHVGAYADAMRHFDPDADPVIVVGDDDTAPRCASFRKLDGNDAALCDQARGHEGDHGTVDPGDGPMHWPRTHSGEVCGDVVTAGPLVLNCELPLGHDGDEHWSAHGGAGSVWPRGVNPRGITGPAPRPDVGYPGKPVPCAQCDTDTHVCQGCGLPTAHDGAHACEHPDGSHYVAPVETIAGTDDGGTPNPLYPNACGDWQTDDDGFRGSDSDTCMLPSAHTGIHIGRTGQRWARTEPVEIPAQRTETADIPGVGTVTATISGEVSGLAIIGGMLANGEPYAEVTATMNSGTALATLEHSVGTIVEVGGMSFVKHSNSPFPDHQPGGLAIVTGVGFDLPAVAAEAAGIGHALGIMTSAPGGPRATPPVGLIPPGAPRARQSVSSITTMEDCGLKYRFTYRDQLPQTPAWWNVGGTAFHETVRVIERMADGDASLPMHAAAEDAQFWQVGDLLEQQQTAGKLFANRLDVEIAKLETESGVASQSWRAADKGKENGEWWRAAGDDMARLYVSQRLSWVRDWRLVKTLTGGTAQEIEFNHRFGSVELKGFIDDLWVNRTDPTRVAVRDLKAGKRPPESDFQLEVYGEVVKALPTELAFTAEPLRVEGTYYLARKGVDTSPVQLGGNAEIITYRAEQVQRADDAGIFMPRPSSFCGSCPFKSKCPAVK